MKLKRDTKLGEESACQSWLKGFDKVWPEHLKVSKIFTLIGSFLAKWILFELKKYRGVIFQEIEEGYKIWREIDLTIQNWHEEFDKFWLEHSKFSKIFTLIVSFLAKYILFELKKYRGVIFHGTEEGYKIWTKTDLLLGKWHEEFTKCSPEHSKVSQLELWWGLFVQSRKCMTLKFTEELCVMTMKNDTKLKRNWLAVLKLTWGTSQILTWALDQNWLLTGSLWPKYIYIIWATKVQRSYLSWHWRDMQILKKNWLENWFEKRLEKFVKFSPEHLKVSKLGLWWDPFVQSIKGMTLKFAEELCVMRMKNNAKS